MKRKELLSFAATGIDLEINHTKGSKPERSPKKKKKTNFMISHVDSKNKRIQMNLKQRETHRHRK